MSSAPSSSRPSAEPRFDLSYSIDAFPHDPNADSQFLFRRVEEAMIQEGLVPGGRTLDVACGTAHLAKAITERGGEGWGIEPSNEMIGVSRFIYPRESSVLVRGIAEVLPFRDASFDRIVCQGSLDHFVEPWDFTREAARVVKPDGRVVIALSNYESLSCKLGRILRGHVPEEYPYYRPPADHYHKGDLAFVRRLGGRGLRLERCYGLSLLWLLRDGGDWKWGEWLNDLPPRLAKSILIVLDRIAYRVPALADMMVSVWRPVRAEQR